MEFRQANYRRWLNFLSSYRLGMWRLIAAFLLKQYEDRITSL